MTHELKTDPKVFDAVQSGEKTFEIRWDDRGYETGDTLLLRRTKYSADQMRRGDALEYTGEEIYKTITNILRGPIYGLHAGWVILSIK